MLTKATQKLIQTLDTRKGRRKEGLFVAEGPKLVAELLGHFACVHIVATEAWLAQAEELLDRCSDASQPLVDVVTEEKLRQVSLQQTPQQVLALFRIPPDEAELASVAASQLTIALDGVQDPGNLGTIVRLADWFGVHDIWCSPGTADMCTCTLC